MAHRYVKVEVTGELIAPVRMRFTKSIWVQRRSQIRRRLRAEFGSIPGCVFGEKLELKPVDDVVIPRRRLRRSRRGKFDLRRHGGRC